MSKHKPALPDRQYYRLADAARLLECCVEDLLHYGACGYLEIVAAVTKLHVTGRKYNNVKFCEEDYAEQVNYFEFAFVQVRNDYLRAIELTGHAEMRAAEVCYRAVGKYLIPTKASDVPELFDEMQAPEFKNRQLFWMLSKADLHDEVDNAEELQIGIRISVPDLWVLTGEIDRFQREGSSHARVDDPLPQEPPKLHGNTEYNSKRRLNVLTAACQVKIHFPDCIENKPASNWAATDWAEALDAKAPLFWPETGKPPLENSVIVDLLRNAMRKP